MKPTAVILAGGKGTRFSPFVTNKTLWPLLGKVTLQHTIEAVSEAGIENIIVVGSQNNENFLKSYQNASINLVYRLQNEALGMDDALKSVFDLVSTRPIIVLNAVDFFETNLIKRIVEKAESSDYRLIVGGYKSDNLLPVGYYQLEGDKIVGVIEKPTQAQKPSDVVRLVIDYFKDPDELISLFDQFHNEDTKDCRYEKSLDLLLGKYSASIEYSAYWSKLKYPHYVLDVINLLLKHKIQPFVHPSARISTRATIDGPVFIDSDARIDDFAVIRGPTYIGKRVLVGNHTLVRHSMIEEGTTIGFGSEIARSYVGPDCQIHHSFVGDSILEKAVNMSWGTVTANLRLDRQNIRYKLPEGSVVDTNRAKLGAIIAKEAFLGVNVCTMPGVCIGANAQILPSTVVQ